MSYLIHHHSEVPKLFDDSFLSDFFWPLETRKAGVERFFANGLAAVDVYEDEAGVRIRMDVPGVRKEAVKLSVENGVLTVSGERQEEPTNEKTRCHVAERGTGSFSRRFTLGEQVDAEAIKARLENGVLEITLGKKEEIKPRQIQVS